MFRLLTTLAVVLALLLTATVPAAAQTWVQLRYWPTSVKWSIDGGSTPTWNANLIGVSLRREVMAPWSLSFNGDFGSQSSWAGFGSPPTTGTDSMWNFNVHHNWSAGPSALSVFAGWGRVGWSSDTQGALRVSGIRAGADVRHMAGPWTVMAWAAFGIGANATREASSLSVSASGSKSDLGAVVGYMFPSGFSLDLGYRRVSMSWVGGGGFLASTTDWSGVILGVSKSFP